LARILQSLTNIPYWLVLHGIEVWDELTPAKLAALKAAERYIVLSQFTLHATAKSHGLAQPCSVWLPPFFRIPATENLPKADSVSQSVLTVGRLSASERYKGHDVMLEAWADVRARVPAATYMIVGDGDDHARLQEKAQQLGLGDSVKFTGTLTGEALDACYARSAVFAMPARSEPFAKPPLGEGFGLVYVEAMSHGVPVIAARDGAPAEFIREGEFGFLVNATDRREVADAIASLLDDRGRARAMGAAGRAWVESELSFDKFCGRLRAALAEGTTRES